VTNTKLSGAIWPKVMMTDIIKTTHEKSCQDIPRLFTTFTDIFCIFY